MMRRPKTQNNYLIDVDEIFIRLTLVLRSLRKHSCAAFLPVCVVLFSNISLPVETNGTQKSSRGTMCCGS